MNLRIPPPPPQAFGQKLSVQKGRKQKSDYVQFTGEKVKIIEVLCMKENN